MPRVARTIIPRIRNSIQQRGLWVSLRRSFLLPVHLLREFRQSRRLQPTGSYDTFDRDLGVETEGQLEGWTYVSDLDIPSANWIHGNNYSPIEPERFRAAMSALPLNYEEFVFIDFGSGKGRALLLAAEFPFKQILGVEFSPQLHAIAQANIQRRVVSNSAHSTQGAGRIQSVCMDFLDFPLPPAPSVYFFFDPCDEYVLAKLLGRIEDSLHAHPRQLYLIYLAPTAVKEQMLDSAHLLSKLVKDTPRNFCLYRSA